jgi:hypothetical protein
LTEASLNRSVLAPLSVAVLVSVKEYLPSVYLVGSLGHVNGSEKGSVVLLEISFE